MDPHRHGHRRDRRPGGGGDFLGQTTAVGVAEHHQPRPGLGGRLDRLPGVVGVELPAVEEMLGVENHLASGLDQAGDALADHGQVLRAAGAQHLRGMEDRRLAHQGDHLRAGVQQGLEPLVLGGLSPLAPRHAEGADPDVLEIQLADPLKVLKVLFIGGGVSAFDVVEAHGVELLGQGELVLEREADALALSAVSQRGVVKFNATHVVTKTEKALRSLSTSGLDLSVSRRKPLRPPAANNCDPHHDLDARGGDGGETQYVGNLGEHRRARVPDSDSADATRILKSTYATAGRQVRPASLTRGGRGFVGWQRSSFFPAGSTAQAQPRSLCRPE